MKKGLLLILILVAAGVGLWSFHRENPQQYVSQISYEMKCSACQAVFSKTAEELERMVQKGEAESPPEQLRRFKCPKCGKIAAYTTAGMNAQ